MKGSYFIIPLVVYPYDVLVSIDEKDDVLLKRLVRLGVKHENLEEAIKITGRGRCVMLDSNQSLIRLERQLKRYDMCGLITHEVFHAVSFILERIGMKFEVMVSDEAYAYLMQYLTMEICKKCGDKYSNPELLP